MRFQVILAKNNTMRLIIETDDLVTIQTLIEVAQSLGLTYELEETNEIVSEDERLLRMEIIRNFKGGLAKYSTDYEPSKQEWYEQGT